MLLQIRDFIRQEGVVSTQQLTRAFHLDESALKPMLDFWLAKKAIQICGDNVNCNSGCQGCKKPVEFYQCCSN